MLAAEAGDEGSEDLVDDNDESAQDNAAIEDGRDTEASEVEKHEILTKISDDNLSGGSQEEVNNMIG